VYAWERSGRHPLGGAPIRSDASPVPPSGGAAYRSVNATFRAGPNDRLKGHLYVAGVSSGSPYVERFRIAHGVPEPTPDRTYFVTENALASSRL
jgi:hypothetical protein